MSSGFTENARTIVNRIKPYIGLGLLAFIIVWVLREGYPVEKLSFPFVISTLLVAVASSFINALTISEISRIHGGAMDYRYSLYTTALGTFANAAGGIPIGTALKYVLLYKKGKLTVAQITSGFVVFAISILLILLSYVAVLIQWVDVTDTYRQLAVLVLVVSIVLLVLAIYLLRYFPRIQRHFSPFLRSPAMIRVFVVSLLVTSTYILNFWIVAYYLFPQMTFVQTAFAVSLGSLISQTAFLQSVGGIQELSIGIASHVTGIDLIQGIMLGLTIRIIALIISGLILSDYFLRSRKEKPGRIA